MNVNFNLKAEIIRKYGSQIEAAHQWGIEETRLSRIIRNYATPLERERQAMEDAFGKKLVRNLFRDALKQEAR